MLSNFSQGDRDSILCFVQQVIEIYIYIHTERENPVGAVVHRDVNIVLQNLV